MENEFACIIVEEKYPQSNLDKSVLIYQNKFVRVELAGDEPYYFHAEIRRIVDGEVTSYADKKNNVGFENLRQLETGSCDNFDFNIYKIGWLDTLKETANLFIRNKHIFTTSHWIDTDRLEEIEDNYFYEKYGFKPSANKGKLDYFQLVKKNAIKIFSENGYVISLDSEELAPYEHEHLFRQIVFTNGSTKKVKFSIQDWRDSYYIYYIEVNDRKVFEIDLTKNTDEAEAVAITMAALQSHI